HRERGGRFPEMRARRVRPVREPERVLRGHPRLRGRRQPERLRPARHAGLLRSAGLRRPDLLREHPRRPLLARRPDRLRDRGREHVEPLVSQIVIKAEPTSAGASGSFADLNGDGCKRAGTGFTAALPDGPITVPGAPAGPARPQPYDGTTGSVTTAVSEVFSGSNSPIRD